MTRTSATRSGTSPRGSRSRRCRATGRARSARPRGISSCRSAVSEAVLLAAPWDRLVAGYTAIERLRMQGLPFLNPALQVDAVDFAPWEAFWLGVMITPWFVNLTL